MIHAPAPPLRRRAVLPSVFAALAGLAAALDPAGATGAPAAPKSTPTPQDATAALRAALTQAAQQSIGRLGAPDGFLGNPAVRIPLPGKLAKGEKMLRAVGLGDEADELVLAMNRAAEAAMPEAKGLLVDSVKQMTIQDAAQILAGGDDAATQYFRRMTSERLTELMLPVVRRSTETVGVAQRYNELGAKAKQFGLVEERDATLEGYVTQKALDGLFVTMAAEEAAIRKDPLGQANPLLQQVFGPVGR
jgi:hypothetical protein